MSRIFRMSLRSHHATPSGFSVCLLSLAILAAGAPATASSGAITFEDIARNPNSVLSEYQRTPSASEAKFDQIRLQPVYTFNDVVNTPLKSRGAPGVALIDYDQDGDLDVYVTNGPGTPNSLYENQILQSGELVFVNVAIAVSADLTDQDSSGVCFGDIDNDGDGDLMVLGAGEGNRLLRNDGGTFTDISDDSAAAIAGGDRQSTTCSMGDIDGDGLLDIFVSNTFADWSQQAAILALPFEQNQHDQLLLNQGGNLFADVSAERGLETLQVVAPGAAGISWSGAVFDLDDDGDLDITVANDQAAIPPGRYGGVDRGIIHQFINDGNGYFTDRTVELGTAITGAWMGVSVGDFDCNGRLDFFGSNVGDYMFGNLPLPYALGDTASRWFLQRQDGSFADPGVGDLVGTPFGWGTSTFDYDNDGDLDIVYHGGLEVGPFVDASNPGIVLRNEDCSGSFDWDQAALSGSTDHQRRNVQGVATGDLDLDGFPDVVSVSNFNQPEPIPIAPYPFAWGGPFDAPVSGFVPTFIPTGQPLEFTWSGIRLADGDLSVERNSASNRNRWVRVETLGSVGLTGRGAVNRDGIGAVVRVTPRRGKTVSKPVLGGSSYSSQDSLSSTFGLGHQRHGTVEVSWPGGVKNRLYNVRAGETVRMPEIPCSFDDSSLRPSEYVHCVGGALRDLRNENAVSDRQAVRLFASALRAYASERSSINHGQ